MPARESPSNTHLSIGSGREQGLDAALDRLVSSAWRAGRDGSDTPDRRVTTVRRLEAAPARYAPFPTAIDERGRHVLEARGSRELDTHQAGADQAGASGRN